MRPTSTTTLRSPRRFRAEREGPAPALFVRIDPGSGVSLQQQVHGAIRAAIVGGLLAPGTRLPSSRALASDLGVSRTTTMLAYDQLRAEGYLTARRASGLFVSTDLAEQAPPPPPAAREAAARPSISRRGAALASLPPAAKRIEGPTRPFRIGVGALDLFPARTWARLAARRTRNVTAAQLDYGRSPGLPALRQAIADHLARARGTRLDPDQVFVVGGAQRGLELACELLLDPGDQAWMEDPGYPGAHKALLVTGARAVWVPVDAEGLDVAAGERLAPDARLAYVTPSHQFPAGVTLSAARRQALLAWATRARAWIVEDDYDSEFRYGFRPLPCLHGLDGGQRVVYVGSFAKSLFPSLRLGFLVVPPDLQEPMHALRAASDVHSPTLDQLVLCDFIEGGHFDTHLRRMTTAYRERGEALEAAAERHCGGALRLQPLHAGLHLTAGLEPGLSDVRAYEEATARSVEVMPLSAYHRGEGPPPTGLVLGLGAVRPSAIEAGMERLAAALEAARRVAPPRP